MIRWAAVVMSGFVVSEGSEPMLQPGAIDWHRGTREFLEMASAKDGSASGSGCSSR